MFKVGDKVVCVDAEASGESLVLGKTYVLADVQEEYVVLEGCEESYYCYYWMNSRFKLESEIMDNTTPTELDPLVEIRQCLWLNHGHLAGDDTDAHIDTLARFTPNQGIVYVSCDDTGDEHYQPLALMAQELTQLRNIDNQPYQLFALPWPSAKYSPAGERLPASYANFLILNGAEYDFGSSDSDIIKRIK